MRDRSTGADLSAHSNPPEARIPGRAPTLYLIVALKVIRAAFVLAIALQVFAWLGEDLRPHFDEAVRRVKLDPETQFFRRLGDRIERITPVNEVWAATGALLYSGLLVVEAVGLARRARWAGLLVVAQSVAFIAAEAFVVLRDPSWTLAGLVVLNALIVAYLHRNRDRLFARG